MLLYIDPGTGSMLFTLLIAAIGSLVYLLRGLKARMGILFSRKAKDGAGNETLPLVLFSDHKRYWNIFEPICDELEARGMDAVFYTESPDDPALEKPYRHIRREWIGEGNRAYARLNFLKARVVLSSTPGLDVYQWKRSRDVPFYVHIAHAPGDVTRYRMFGLDYYDAVLLSGEYQIHQIRELERLRGLPAKELRIVGLPYMDAMRSRLAAAGPVPAPETGKRTVLLAPSWGASGILSVYGGEILDALLATGNRIIVRPHPQSFTSEAALLQGLMARYPDSGRLTWNRDNDNFEVLRQADILISDFSGVTFDFALIFDKPVIYADTSFDPAPYDCCWLEEKLWTFETLPRLGRQLTRENLPRVGELIEQCIRGPAYREARERARRETWEYMGEGAKRTVDYLEEKLGTVQE